MIGSWDSVTVQLKPLTSIRFFFALLVVLFHSNHFLFSQSGITANWPVIVINVISHGYFGVNFFFILSGFILSYTYQNKLNRMSDYYSFWGARFARIYPAYLFAFIVYLPLTIFSTINLYSYHAAITAISQMLLLQSWVPATALKWNGPAWSLSVEAFFYALFPFIFIKARIFSKRHLIFYALGAYVLSQIGALIGWYFGSSLCESLNSILGFTDLSIRGEQFLFGMYFPIFRLPEFLFGMALGILFSRMPPLTAIWRKIALLMGCIVFVTGYTSLASLVPSAMITNGLLSMITNALLMPFFGFALFGLAYSRSKFFNHPLSVRLGDASYSLYLLHIPVWGFMVHADKHFMNVQTADPKTFYIAYLASVILVSLLSLKFIEIPGRQLIRGWLKHVLDFQPRIAA